MSLEEFLHHLQFDIEKVKPLDWEVDWRNAPLPYKLYRRVPVVPLSSEVPLILEEQGANTEPNIRVIGHVLWYIFGLTQLCQFTYSNYSEQIVDQMQLFRRFVPSGGALYPNEIYVYLKIDEIPYGVYHYDVAHHRLVLLREGNFDSYLTQVLGNRCDISATFGTVFVSTMFWKNYYKYSNFAYRLQGLDTGVLIGQLLEVSKRFGFDTGVYFQFLDRAVNHLLGLSEQEESVYAIIPLSVDPSITWFTDGKDKMETVSSTELSREIPTICPNHYARNPDVKVSPMLNKINTASMLESTNSFRHIGSKKSNNYDNQMILPYVNQLSYDLAAACVNRHSPEMDFVWRNLNQLQLATLLQEATASFLYRNDLDGRTETEPRVSLYGCFHNIEGIPDGAYRYDSTVHALQQESIGDHRFRLQQGMTLHNVNLFQVPICLHVASDQDHFKKLLGYRGYRIQQMETGMLVQRLLLVASAIGLGGHPLLGFDVGLCDDIYNLTSQRKTSLIQILVGFYRPQAHLAGSLHS